MSEALRLKVVSKLEGEDINAIINDKILALIIEGYYPSELCDSMSEKILESEHVKNYTHEVFEEGKLVQKYYGVDRLGFPFNLTYNSPMESELVQSYYREATLGIARLRHFANPAATPIDKLRLELDEKYQWGANIAAFQGKKMLAGIGRITKAALSYLSAEQPHFDALPLEFANLETQLAANIYLKIPDKGGELEVWDIAPVDPLTKVPQDWRAVLPPSIKIKPKKGDLVIFNCRRPHAIGAFEGVDRVTVQMFIGHQNNKSLQLWN